MVVNLWVFERLFCFVEEWTKWKKEGNIMEMMGFVGQSPRSLMESGCCLLKASEGMQWHGWIGIGKMCGKWLKLGQMEW